MWSSLAERGSPGLVDHLADRAHNWRDFFFFVSFNHLGPIDSDHPHPAQWEPIDTLKSCTTVVPPFRMSPEEQDVNKVLSGIFLRGVVDFRLLKHGWTLYGYIKQEEGRSDINNGSPPEEEEESDHGARCCQLRRIACFPEQGQLQEGPC